MSEDVRDQDYIDVEVPVAEDVVEEVTDAPEDTPDEVTSDDATPNDPKRWDIRADGETHNPTEEELIAGYQKGKNYERKLHALGTWQQIAQLYSNDPRFKDSFDGMVNDYGDNDKEYMGDFEQKLDRRLKSLEQKDKTDRDSRAEAKIKKDYSEMFSDSDLSSMLSNAKAQAMGKPVDEVFRSMYFNQIVNAAKSHGKKELSQKIATRRSDKVITGGSKKQKTERVKITKDQAAAASMMGMTNSDYVLWLRQGDSDIREVLDGGGDLF